jgi:hypothetical protein
MPTENEKKAAQFQAAFPHIPIQDQFGQTHMIFGINKMEYLSAIIAPGFITAFPNALPEVVASLSIETASLILTQCAEQLQEIQKSDQAPKVISMK